MRGQTRSTKREQLLKAAQSLMLSRGYSATTIDDICGTAGVSKGVFYHYFEDKRDLGMHVLQYFMHGLSTRLLLLPTSEVDDPLHRIFLLLDSMGAILSAGAGRDGCLLATFAIETGSSEPAFRKRCAAYFDQWAQLLQVQIDAAIERYAPDVPPDSLQLARFCIAVIEGSLILVRAKGSAAILCENIGSTKAYLSAVFLRGPDGAARRVRLMGLLPEAR